MFQVSVHGLRNCPQHTENQEYAYERRQVGDGLEYRNEDKSAHTKIENCLALYACKILLRTQFYVLALRNHEVALQRKRQDIGRDNHRNQRRDKYLGNDTDCSDYALVPKHNGCYVANRRERATRVGRDNHKRCVDDAVFLLLDELTQNHNHHNGCRKVVEDGREDERHEGDTPQQRALALGLQRVLDKVETAVLVY